MVLLVLPVSGGFLRLLNPYSSESVDLYDCPSASQSALKNMDGQVAWINQWMIWLIQHKIQQTMSIFYGIYSLWLFTTPYKWEHDSWTDFSSIAAKPVSRLHCIHDRFNLILNLIVTSIWSITSFASNWETKISTVYPKNYTHCSPFVVLYHGLVTVLPISLRVMPLVLQSYDYRWGSVATLKDVGK